MGRIFEVINKDTACALGSKKYIKRRTRFCSTRSFSRWVLAAWPQAAKPKLRQVRKYQGTIDIKKSTSCLCYTDYSSFDRFGITFTAQLMVTGFSLSFGVDG